MGSNDKPTVSTIRTENKVTHEPLEIANAFNEFFVSVASKFRTSGESDQEPEEKVLKEFVRTRISTAITFDTPKITPSFIGKYLSHLQTKKAAGLDGISPRLLRAVNSPIVESLAKVINLCLSKATFPTSWKIAKVTPVFKAGDQLNISNCRPISILPVLSKLPSYSSILPQHIFTGIIKTETTGYSRLSATVDDYDFIHKLFSLRLTALVYPDKLIIKHSYPWLTHTSHQRCLKGKHTDNDKLTVYYKTKYNKDKRTDKIVSDMLRKYHTPCMPKKLQLKKTPHTTPHQ